MHEIQTSKESLRRIGVVVLGWSLVIGGIVGLLLPIVPGWILIVLGVLVLRNQHPWLKRALDKLTARFPILQRILNRLSSRRDRWRHWFGINTLRGARSRLGL